jgi:hypothetical protein
VKDCELVEYKLFLLRGDLKWRVTMRGYTNGLLVAACLAVSPLFSAGPVHATAFDVTVDSTLLNGSTAVLAFDFIDGGPPNNTANLRALISNGTQGSTSITGNVTGAGPWAFSDTGNSFFNELLVTFSPMGSALSFSFTLSSNAREVGTGSTFCSDAWSKRQYDAGPIYHNLLPI